MFFRVKKSGPRSYLQIVENRREGRAVRQHVIATLGRIDDLAARGGLATLLASGARFCEQVMLVSALDDPKQAARLSCKRIGGPLLFGRLWERLGIADVLRERLAPRAFAFALERAVFVATLHRLFVSGSDRDCASWMQDYAIPGSASLSPPCTGFSSRARTATARRGCRTMPSRAARVCRHPAPAFRLGLGPRLRVVDAGLCHPGQRELVPPSILPRHGVARGGVA